MRHLGSILLSVILAPVIYVLAGIGVAKVFPEDHFAAGALIGLAALLGAGALYAVLLLARLSPVGTALGGLAYLGISVWFVVSPDMVARLPKSVLGVHGAAALPLSGVTAVLAVPLLATVLSPRRWQRRATPARPAYPAGYQPPASYMPGAEPPMPRYPAPGYQPVPAPGGAAPWADRPVPAQPGPGQPGPGQHGAPQLPEPVGPYQPQMASYAPPNPAAPAPLWPGRPAAGSPADPDDTDGTRRL
jgi:hypothetical protein